MTEALLYQPPQRWRIGVALAAAALIHLAAIALASTQQRNQANETPSFQPGVSEVTFETTEPIDEAPPPDLIIPSSLSPADELFPPEKSNPPPVRKQVSRPSTPRPRERNGNPGLLTLSTAKALALSAPRPEYPYEARRQKITGDGIVLMTIDPRSGSVTDVSMWKSTGSPYLDNAAVAGFRRWRFKPGTVSRVSAPITFTITGAQY